MIIRSASMGSEVCIKWHFLLLCLHAGVRRHAHQCMSTSTPVYVGIPPVYVGIPPVYADY